VAVEGVAAIDPILERMQRRTIGARRREELAVDGIVAGGNEIRRHVGGIHIDGDRRRQVYLLPPGRGLAGEGRGREQSAGGCPKMSDVRAGVVRELVEAKASDHSELVGAELDA